ncbi:MAG: NADPH:quinone oxidoreductase family protein [Tagaea sp.]|nr:NADPH:quinone oxidoreductase family protein [Tagaea sp.]
MRAILCAKPADPPELVLGDIPVPEPGPGQVRIRVKAAGVNFADTLMVRGTYQARPPLPFVPGMELAGQIDALGAGVKGFAVRQRVLATVEHGAFAEFALARAADCAPLPGAMDDATAACFPIAYGTAHAALEWRAGLRRGETLLVLGAAGGVGLAAVEIGKAMGARVIAAAGGAERGALALSRGAETAIDYKREDLREAIKKLTGGAGVDVVFDPVGGDVSDAALRCLGWEGRLIVVGFAAGRIPQIPANLLLIKNVAAIGLFWGAYRARNPDKLAASLDALLTWWDEGALKPLVSARFKLAQAGEALQRLAKRQARGKTAIEID